MPKPSLGQMRDQVTVQTRTTVVSASGEKNLVWASTATVWARAQEQAGNEAVGQHQTQAETVLMVTMRWRADVVPKGRMIFAGKTMDIESVINPDGRKRFIVCVCRRREQ